MAVAKVILNGVTQMDLTSDTIGSSTALSGYTGHGANGEAFQGAYTIPSQYIIPSGTISISSNGTYNITEYASAAVNVSGGGGGGGTHVAKLTTLTYRSGGNNYLYSITQALASQQRVYTFAYSGSEYYYGGQSFTFTAGDILTVTFNGSNNIRSYKQTSVYKDSGDLLIGETHDIYSSYQYSLTLPDYDIDIETYCNVANIISDYMANYRGAVAHGAFINYQMYVSGLTYCRPFAFAGTLSGPEYAQFSFPNLLTIGNNAFASNNWISTMCAPALQTIGSYAFASMDGRMTYVSFPEVLSIDSGAFAYCNVQNVSFAKVLSCSTEAFRQCGALTTVNMPKVEFLGYGCFSFCSMLRNVTVPELLSIGSYAFYSCASMTSFSAPKLTDIGTYTFAYCAQLTDFYAPNLTNAAAWAFAYCYSLPSLSLSKLTTVASYFASNCSSLSYVNFQVASVIYNNAFASCSNLKEVYASSVTSVAGMAFEACSTLSFVDFDKLSYVGSSAFRNCSSLLSISLPYLDHIYNSCFYGCSMLQSISLPNVSNISQYAFYKCSSLSTVIINEWLDVFGSYCFANCARLLSFYLLSTAFTSMLTYRYIFNGTPIAGYTTDTGGVYGSIFVPEALYSTYISATNWAAYSDRIVSLTDAQISNVLQYGTHEPT